MPSNTEFLLDTSILVAAFRGDAAIRDHMAQGYTAYISAVTLGELLVGAYRSVAVQANVAHVLALGEAARVLACDAVTASVYARIASGLIARGKRIPDNDTWIAATAQQHALTLVTRDQHFLSVPDLNLVTW